MVTARKTTTKSASKNGSNGRQVANSTRSKSNNGAHREITAPQLAKVIVAKIAKVYKVELANRDSRLVRKVAYAVREKLGKDIQAQLEKQNRNGNGNLKFDWKRWNTEIFPKIVGDPDKMPYSAELLADAMALIYDSIPADTEGAITSLVELNLQSLQARNNAFNKDEIDLDDIEDDEEIDNFIEDELDDEDDFELDDDSDDEDDDDFELDE